MLKYDGGGAPTGVGALISNKEGNCVDWADFFIECLAIHGITEYTGEEVRAVSPANAMYMKTWSFSSNINATTWETGTANQCNPVAGMPYQGVTNPAAALFGYHQIVYHGTTGAYTYYDPTYGSKTDTTSVLSDAQNAYENSAVQGFLKTDDGKIKLNNTSNLETTFSQ